MYGCTFTLSTERQKRTQKETTVLTQTTHTHTHTHTTPPTTTQKHKHKCTPFNKMLRASFFRSPTLSQLPPPPPLPPPAAADAAEAAAILGGRGVDLLENGDGSLDWLARIVGEGTVRFVQSLVQHRASLVQHRDSQQ